jgi:hypothetical protein
MIFLKRSHRHESPFSHSFQDNQTIKHLVEAMGVPHTEVGAILANGKLVNPNYIVADQDIIDIFPSQAQAAMPHPPSFILDNHLGRLAAYLRMLGFDSLYRNDFQDDELAEIASFTNRVLLTRDLRLLMRKSVNLGYWIRSKDPKTQIAEVVRRFEISNMIEPFKRCMRCNALLIPVEKNQVLSQLQPLTKEYFNEFRKCPDCNQVYWQGSHYDHMTSFIQQISQDN